MSKLHHYLSMIVFMAGVMVGVQAPNFVDQYVKRIDAHYLEVEANFSHYQDIADLYHNGSVESLIARHEGSEDSTFRAEADAIRNNYTRLQRFKVERNALDGSIWHQMFFVLRSGDRKIIKETWVNYSANVPLNLEAGICGIAFGCILSVVFELLLSLLGVSFRRVRSPGV